MALVVRSKDTSHTGNGIIYDGGISETTGNEVFYVETDFGNHIKLTWQDIEYMYAIIRWTDYDRWRADRDELRGAIPYSRGETNGCLGYS